MTVRGRAAQTVRALAERLVEELRPRKVGLFGSYASGRPHRDCDIDGLIVLDTQEPFFDRLARARRAVAGLHPGVPLDPLVLTSREVEERTRAGEQFLAAVLERGEVLYAA